MTRRSRRNQQPQPPTGGAVDPRIMAMRADMEEQALREQEAAFQLHVQEMVHKVAADVYARRISQRLTDEGYAYGDKIPPEWCQEEAKIARNVAPFILEAFGLGKPTLKNLPLIEGEDEPEPEQQPESESDEERPAEGTSTIIMP